MTPAERAVVVPIAPCTPLPADQRRESLVHRIRAAQAHADRLKARLPRSRTAYRMAEFQLSQLRNLAAAVDPGALEVS